MTARLIHGMELDLLQRDEQWKVSSLHATDDWKEIGLLARALVFLEREAFHWRDPIDCEDPGIRGLVSY